MNSSGRGATSNPAHRFATSDTILDETGDAPNPRTRFEPDAARSIITTNDSPDIPFSASLNPYRGCEHGCAYCFARPTHEFLGFSPGLDFETRILVKHDAPKLLRHELSAASWDARPLALSTVTDCYQPIERRLELTRACLAVLAEFLQPVGVITKNHLVTRDTDLLAELARHSAAHVSISLTTLDPGLAKRLEPRASPPARRLAAIRELSDAGIPVAILMAPCIPGLTDHEIPAVFAAAAAAGACEASIIPLRLPGAVAGIFTEWLETHLPGSRDRILGRIQDLRGGRLNDPNFTSRFRGQGVHADLMRSLARNARRRLNLPGLPTLSSAAFRPPQLRLL